MKTHHSFCYLTDESSEDLHVVSVYGPNIPDTSNPPGQQLSGVYGPFSTVWRHHQVKHFLPVVRTLP